MNQRLGKAFINILIKISNVCAIFTKLIIFSSEQFFYKIRYSTHAKHGFVTSVNLKKDVKESCNKPNE